MYIFLARFFPGGKSTVFRTNNSELNHKIPKGLEKQNPRISGVLKVSGPTRARTWDHLIMSQVL